MESKYNAALVGWDRDDQDLTVYCKCCGRRKGNEITEKLGAIYAANKEAFEFRMCDECEDFQEILSKCCKKHWIIDYDSKTDSFKLICSGCEKSIE